MARAIYRLTARQVATLKDTGRHADDGGLYLRITSAGARCWVFMSVRGGKRSEIGLGAVSSIPLATARQIAGAMREAVALGRDPRDLLARTQKEAKARIPTFGEFAEHYIASVEDGWRNPVHRQQWRNSLRDHAAGIHDIPVDEIETDDILAVLQPIWLTKAETAKRVRGRIERILDAAKAMGHRSPETLNPAMWRGHLALLLPQQTKLARGHHAALPWADALSFMSNLRERRADAARALEFLILTAARSGEVLGATWGEVDLEKRLWVVPASRMKAGEEHIVPLSETAVSLLRKLRLESSGSDGAIFAIHGAARSNMAMSMLLRRMGFGHVTVHGFRSTFRDWAGDSTEHPRELIEQALAHTKQNKAERAYGSCHHAQRWASTRPKALLIAGRNFGLRPGSAEVPRDENVCPPRRSLRQGGAIRRSK